MTDEYFKDNDFVLKAEDKGFEKETVDLGVFLDNLKYPISRSKILEEARKKKMKDDMLQFLKRISNKTYESPEDVMGEITGDSAMPTTPDTEEPNQ